MSEETGTSRSPTVRSAKRRWGWIILIIFVLADLAMGLLYQYIKQGGLRARQEPPAWEAMVAHKLVDLSIPKEARAQVNPLSAEPDGAAVAAGRGLYEKHCEVCHSHDGSGRTSAGGGLYPPPRDLQRSAVALRGRTDGELFYLIRNGIRNTGMPGWQLPDKETWELVAYIRQLPITAGAEPSTAKNGPAPGTARYMGSVSCKGCHREIYEHWLKTPMANVVRDPREHPDVILPDLSKSDPLVTFTKADIALVYGSLWKQRYFKQVGDDYYVFPAQWDVTHKKWKPYFAKDDWWSPFYPPDNFQRPTGPLCDGCHSVNYNIETKKVTEWNVGCEKCHGPGSEHVKHPVAENILNPSRLDYIAGNDTCIQCHSQGQPLKNPIAGKYYDWPVGYDVALKLSDYWKLEPHKLGETSFTHFADGTAHKNRMQGNDYVTSQMYVHGVTCFTCHDAHGTTHPSNLRKPAQQLCLDCHGPKSPNGPHAVSLEQHTHHKPDSAGSQCIACHMPKIAATIGDVNVRSHTFRFVGPTKTDNLKTPNACNACHADKPTSWTADALKTWSDHSPWRMAD